MKFLFHCLIQWQLDVYLFAANPFIDADVQITSIKSNIGLKIYDF